AAIALKAQCDQAHGTGIYSEGKTNPDYCNLCRGIRTSVAFFGRSVQVRQQVRYPDTKSSRETHEDAYSGISLAALDAAHVGQGEAAGVGYLLLGEAAFGADSEDVSAEAVEGIA